MVGLFGRGVITRWSCSPSLLAQLLLLSAAPWANGFSASHLSLVRKGMHETSPVPKVTAFRGIGVMMTRMGGGRELASSLFQGEDKRSIILFDGVCNMCNGGVNRELPQARRHHKIASFAWQVLMFRQLVSGSRH